jgi:Glu-tRNA(Gln) amidotransferase subunit E-like FAD-binding protein
MEEEMKPIKLSAKEIRRASDDGYTVVTRPQPDGLVMVAIVNLKTCLPVFKPSFVTKDLVSKAVAEDVRMLDKCGLGDHMAWASRDRNFCRG